MNSECPVTFIIPVYNVRDYLGELLQSIKEQSFGNFRVIIGDDGSTDDTQLAAETFLRDSRFEYLRFQENRGLGAVMKDLMSRVRTRYWCNPGGDDRLHPEFLERRLAAAAEVENPIIVHGTPRQIDTEGLVIQRLPVFELPRRMSSSVFLEVLLYHNVVINPGVLVSTAHTRQCIDKMRTDLKYAPDWYWWILHSSLEGDVVFDPIPCMDYRYHSSSLSGSTSMRMKLIRVEEIRRAPLLALHDASTYSDTASTLLQKYENDLMGLWVLRMIKVLIGSRGGFEIPHVPWLPDNCFMRMIFLLRMIPAAINACRLRPRKQAGGTFTPSGHPLATHSCLRVVSIGEHVACGNH